MNITFKKVASGAAATVLVLGASFASVTSAQAADEGGTVVTACVNKKTGNMRMPAAGTACKSTETAMTWISADAPAPAKVVDANGRKVPYIVTVAGPGDSALAIAASPTGKYLWRLDFASGEYGRMSMNYGFIQDSKGNFQSGGLYADPTCTVPAVMASDVPGNASVQIVAPRTMTGGLTYGLKKRVSAIPFVKYWSPSLAGFVCSRNFVFKEVSALQPAGYYPDFNAAWLFPMDLNNELRKPDNRVAPLMAIATD